jgi:DNA-binding SARP family transcriptional activator
MPGTCRITLMGHFDVAVEGRPVRAGAWHHGADSLVKLLALERTHRCPRSQVTARLWPRLDARAAERHLLKAVRSACRALGTSSGVTLDGDLVQLWPTGALDVDVIRFEVLAQRAASERGAREALQAYGGELLPDDRHLPWTEQHRAEVRDARLRLLATCGQLPGVIDLTHTQRVLTELQALRPR